MANNMPMKPEQDKADKPASKGGYGKRPLWQWILIYLVVGGLIYYAVYYFYFRNHGYNYGGSSTNTTQNSPY